MSEGLGINRMTILRILAETPESTAGMKKRLSQITAKPFTQRALDRLAGEGLIKLTFGKWRLTNAGKQALPQNAPKLNFRPYVPPKHPRREGSLDFLRCPSVFAGRRIPR